MCKPKPKETESHFCWVTGGHHVRCETALVWLGASVEPALFPRPIRVLAVACDMNLPARLPRAMTPLFNLSSNHHCIFLGCLADSSLVVRVLCCPTQPAGVSGAFAVAAAFQRSGDSLLDAVRELHHLLRRRKAKAVPTAKVWPPLVSLSRSRANPVLNFSSPNFIRSS